ncbi:MAG TPA: hypothetical protein VKV79_08230 [Terriglobia bacterium]|nr:hypothetical protein [Terriglobia bacterium]
MNALSEPCWMVYAGFVISIATLIVLIWYACLTRGIEKAANEQSEGLSKPLVVPVICPREPLIGRFGNSQGGLQAQSLQQAAEERYEFAGKLKLSPTDGIDYLKLVNIGNGAAMCIRCVLETGFTQQYLPYLRAGEALQIGFSKSWLQGGGTILCEFEGVSGRYYSKVPFTRDFTVGRMEFGRLPKTHSSTGKHEGVAQRQVMPTS